MANMFHAYALLQIRKQLRLTQQQMADLMGLPKHRYMKIEKAHDNVKLEEIKSFFNTLNIDQKPYDDVITYMAKHYLRESVYQPTESKYFGAMLPIPHLQKVTLDLLEIGLNIEQYVLTKRIKYAY